MPNLALDNATYIYKNARKAAVLKASCVFEAGRSYAIVGPSGSGKSTLLSMLAGLDLPTGGEVSFDGGSLVGLDLDRYRRECITMVFQSFHLFPLLTVIENVCFPMELRGVMPKDARPKAAKLLESVGITKEQMKRFPSRLSGGEQQRVAIARSLASGARIILSDEPTGNLDIKNTKNIIEMLHGLAHDKGYCVITVTHDLEVAETADVVFRMKDGELQAG